MPRLLAFALVTLASASRPSYLGRHTVASILLEQRRLDNAVDGEILRPIAKLAVEAQLPQTREYTVFSVAGLNSSLSNSYVGVWCAGHSLSALIDWVDFDNSSSDELQLRLHHIGCPQVIRIICRSCGSQETPAVIATSAPIVLDPSQQLPYALRFSYGDDPAHSMWVSWTSASNASAPVVNVSSGGKLVTFTGQSRKYFAGDACNAPSNTTSVLYYLDPGWTHDVLVTGLLPSTRYYIAFGQNASEMGNGSFRTAAVVGRDTPVAFAAYGDMALSFDPGATSTVRLVEQLAGASNGTGLDFVAHFGDLGYAEGSTVVWDVWMAYVAPLLALLPYQVSVGNHEANHQIGLPCPNNWAGEPLQFAPKWGNFGDDSQGEGGVGTFFRFKAPASTPGGIPSNSIFWYSFNIGALHFIQFSGEHDFTPGSRQYAWLSADLAAVNHSTTPWTVATVHRPMRNACEDSDFNVGQGMADALEALFLDGGVDLVLGGHYHLYQRTCNIRNGTCVANNTGPGRGMSHITVGSAGATTHNETITPGVPASWVAKYLPLVWGWGAVNVVNRSAMQWRFFSNELGIAAPLDEVWYYK